MRPWLQRAAADSTPIAPDTIQIAIASIILSRVAKADWP